MHNTQLASVSKNSHFHRPNKNPDDIAALLSILSTSSHGSFSYTSVNPPGFLYFPVPAALREIRHISRTGPRRGCERCATKIGEPDDWSLIYPVV